MTYYGRSLDNISNVEKLDNITFNGGTTYALTKSSTAFTPAGANNILISIDGVVQQGNFSVSGSNIVFTFSPTSSNTCDFIMHYGTGLITTPGDSTVTTAKIGADAVDGTKIADDSISDEHLDITAITGQTAITSLADTDKFLVSDASDSGNLKYVEKQYLPSGGLQFIQSQIVSSNTTVVNFNDVFSATYDNYFFLFDATLENVATMEMRYRTGSPTNDNYTGANTYRYAFSGSDSTGGSVSQNSNANNKWTMGDTTYAAINIGPPAVHGFIHFNTPFTASTQRTWTSTFVVYNNNDEQRAFSGGGRVVNGTQMTGFGFSCSSGDFTKFTGRIYGVVDS